MERRQRKAEQDRRQASSKIVRTPHGDVGKNLAGT